jgi:hypothetical protein
MEPWKATLDAYPPDQQSELCFTSRVEAGLALQMLWDAPLRSCPHAFSTHGMVVPSAAVPYFQQGGVEFRLGHLKQ